MMSDTELRLECLRLAIQNYSPAELVSIKQVIDLAACYTAFIFNNARQLQEIAAPEPTKTKPDYTIDTRLPPNTYA